MINALVINSKDNVAVVIEEIKKGSKVAYKDTEGETVTIIALDNIPIYHKVAISNIKKDTHIVKYGEHIGLALNDIKIGEHVHVQNVRNVREDLYV